MADIDWGNTRAPMTPPQMGNAGQPGAAQTGYGTGYQAHPQDAGYGAQGHYDAAQMQGHGGYAAPSPYGYPHTDPAAYHAQSHSQSRPQGQHSAPYPAQSQAEHSAYAHNGYAPNPGASDPAGGGMPPRFGALANYAGAAVSLALVAGLAVWGYQLAVRDVSGIPVVRALEGPMRVQPVDPGGQTAAHQGLAVNAVQASGAASAPSDRVALAPAPDTLDVEDLPADPSAVARQQPNTPVLRPVEVAAESALLPTPEPAVDMAALPVDPVAAALAIADQISKNTQPLSEVTRISAPSPSVAPLLVGPKIISASVPGVRQSPRPLTRPADLPTVAPLAVALTTPTPATAAEVTPDTIPAGTRLVQLGAFDSADVARAEWSKLSDRFEEYIPGKTRVIQKAQSGGKTFYRLRAMGFKDLADARRFCSALMAGKAACIPVVTR